MFRKASGLAMRVGTNGFDPAAVSALQELIGLIHEAQTNVARLELGGYDLYLFVVKRSIRRQGTLKMTPRKSIKAANTGRRRDDITGPARALFDSLTEAACRCSKVASEELASSAKSKPLSFARALVAYYTNLSGVGSYTQVASLLNVHPNSLHLSIRRYKKLLPAFFNMSVEQFRASRGAPTGELVSVMGERWATPSETPTARSDAEIGTRIANALASE
jgi:hypothetical protein